MPASSRKVCIKTERFDDNNSATQNDATACRRAFDTDPLTHAQVRMQKTQDQISQSESANLSQDAAISATIRDASIQAQSCKLREQNVNNKNGKANIRAKRKRADRSSMIRGTQTKLPWADHRLSAECVAQHRKAKPATSDQDGRGPSSIPCVTHEELGLQQPNTTGHRHAINSQEGKGHPTAPRSIQTSQAGSRPEPGTADAPDLVEVARQLAILTVRNVDSLQSLAMDREHMLFLQGGDGSFLPTLIKLSAHQLKEAHQIQQSLRSLMVQTFWSELLSSTSQVVQSAQRQKILEEQNILDSELKWLYLVKETDIWIRFNALQALPRV